MFLQHELLVADVMVTIDLACRQNGIRLLTEHELAPHSERFRWKVKIQGGSKLSVVPDRVFALESQNDNSESNRAFFFLEADRGTMPVIRKTLSQTSFYRKLLAYEATWSQSIHLARFGFHRFRVLTVTTSAERVKSLVDACSKLKGGHGLFLFADQTILSGNILSSTWQTGKPGETGRLLH
jgi:hypothetical protein